MSGPDAPSVGGDGAGDEGFAVRVGRQLSESTTTIGRARLSLVMGLGEMGDDDLQVLIPFLDCELYGLDEADPLWTGRLTLDNVAFLMEQSADRVAELLPPLASMLRGDVGAPAGRLDYAADRMAAAADTLATAATQLRGLAAKRSVRHPEDLEDESTEE